MNSLPPSRDLPGLRSRRDHLVSEISAPRRKAARGRLFGGLLAGAALAVAGGVAAALLAVPADGPSPQEEPVRLPAGSEILTRAAHRAGSEPELRPKPGQYLYFEEKGEQDHFSRGWRMAEDGTKKDLHIVRRGESSHSEFWYPVGGRSPGMMRSSSEGYQVRWPGEIEPEKTEGYGWICASYRNVSEAGRSDMKVVPDCKAGDDRYRRDLPTDVSAMLEWLYGDRRKQEWTPPDVAAFGRLVEAVRGSYVPPKSRAALFAAASRIPGTTVTRDVTDLVGRKGVAVGMTWNSVRSELIFDAATFELLGEREVMDYDESSWPLARSGTPPRSPDPELAGYMKPGHVMAQSVTLRVALVDDLGRRP